MITPHVGMVFEHAQWCRPDGNPVVYRITKIADDLVRYKPVDGGHTDREFLTDFPRRVKRVLDKR